MLSVRVPEELLVWVDHYAGQRTSTRTAVVVAALEGFRGLTASGVPDLPGADKRSRGQRNSPARKKRSLGGPLPSAAAVVRAETLGVHPDVLARQRKLNAGKYGGKP